MPSTQVPSLRRRWFAGLMSGTSLDGVDAVLVRFEDVGSDAGPTHRQDSDASEPAVSILALHHAHAAFPSALQADLLALQTPGGSDELARAALAATALAHLYAETLKPLLGIAGVSGREVAAIGAHGQTVRHQPAAGYSLQLLDGALLAERAGIPVVCDLRSADVAAGGQGAPLVPAFHAALLGTLEPRVVVNLGGMANLTVLGPGRPVTGFDCGPGNVLLDAWIRHRRGLAFDADGAWSATGKVLPALLERLLAHPFVARMPPKSCGREEFDLHWLLGQAIDRADAADVQATLAEFTARCVADAIAEYAAEAQVVLVCGGGANNRDLLSRLRAAMPDRRLATTDEVRLDPMHVEAAAFAWLARQRLSGMPGNLPAVTGARGPRVLGALYAAP